MAALKPVHHRMGWGRAATFMPALLSGRRASPRTKSIHSHLNRGTTRIEVVALPGARAPLHEATRRGTPDFKCIEHYIRNTSIDGNNRVIVITDGLRYDTTRSLALQSTAGKAKRHRGAPPYHIPVYC